MQCVVLEDQFAQRTYYISLQVKKLKQTCKIISITLTRGNTTINCNLLLLDPKKNAFMSFLSFKSSILVHCNCTQNSSQHVFLLPNKERDTAGL